MITDHIRCTCISERSITRKERLPVEVAFTVTKEREGKAQRKCKNERKLKIVSSFFYYYT